MDHLTRFGFVCKQAVAVCRHPDDTVLVGDDAIAGFAVQAPQFAAEDVFQMADVPILCIDMPYVTIVSEQERIPPVIST